MQAITQFIKDVFLSPRVGSEIHAVTGGISGIGAVDTLKNVLRRESKIRETLHEYTLKFMDIDKGCKDPADFAADTMRLQNEYAEKIAGL